MTLNVSEFVCPWIPRFVPITPPFENIHTRYYNQTHRCCRVAAAASSVDKPLLAAMFGCYHIAPRIDRAPGTDQNTNDRSPLFASRGRTRKDSWSVHKPNNSQA